MAELVIALTDLLEAEGWAFRRGIARTGGGLMLLCVAALMAFAGLSLWLWAVYLLAAEFVPPALAAGLTGLASLFAAGCVLWLAARLISR